MASSLYARQVLTAGASAARHSLALPAVPLKCPSFVISLARSVRHRHERATNLRDIQSANVARLYARRVMEIAAAAAATRVAVARLESSSTLISKPAEWSTVDLDEQRRLFGENISSLGKTAVGRVWAAGVRMASLALLASPMALLGPVAYLAGKESRAADAAWEYALWSIEKAGPTYIKLCQWATTRNDLFSAEFVSRFSRLQDETMGHSWKSTQDRLASAYGCQYDDVLDFHMDDESDRKEPKPIGSGCIAQVYRAKLKVPTALLPVGTEVAVKVTHPDILHKVCVDFYIMKKFTALMEKIPRLNLDYLSMRDSVEQFASIMIPQLDLTVEASNLRRFRRDFADEDQLAFPVPIDDLTCKDVLVESFIHGDPILHFMSTAPVKEKQELAKIGLETVMKMIFLNDFVHGDLHPGNIIVDHNKNVRGHPVRMNMIDCGLIVEMGEREHVNLTKILGAFIKKDGLLAGQLMIDTAKKCQATALDMEVFCRGIQKIIEDDEDQNFLESVGDYLADICHLAVKHKVKLESAFMNAALACEIMEGLASSLYPNMKVQSIALPAVAKAEMMHGLRGIRKKGLGGLF